MIYVPNKPLILSTVRQPAALLAPAPLNHDTQFPMNQSAPYSSAIMKLPKLILENFSGKPLNWPELSERCLATIDQTLADESVKEKYFKTLGTGRAKAAIEGMGYNAGTCRVAKDILARGFGWPELVVKAKLKMLHSHHFIKSHDTAEVTNYCHIVSPCVNVLSQYGYESDLTSDSVLKNAVMKLPIELEAKWLIYLLRFNPSFQTKQGFTSWLRDFAEVQENPKRLFGFATDKSIFAAKAENQKSTGFASEARDQSNQESCCPMTDGEHKIWNCNQLKKMATKDRNETLKKRNLCFLWQNEGHRANQCKLSGNCGKDGCTRKLNRLLQRDGNDRRNGHLANCEANRVLPANANSFEMPDVKGCKLVWTATGLWHWIHIVFQRFQNQIFAGHWWNKTDTQCGGHKWHERHDMWKSLSEIIWEQSWWNSDVSGLSKWVPRELQEWFFANQTEIQAFENFAECNCWFTWCESFPRTKWLSSALPSRLKELSKKRAFGCKDKTGLEVQWTLAKTRKCTGSNYFSASDHDQLAEQLKICWNSKSYASHCNVSSRYREDKEAIE